MHPNPAAQFCRGFVDLRVPDALQSIGDCAISKCTSGSVGPRLPDALLSVSNAALWGCSGTVGLRFNILLQLGAAAQLLPGAPEPSNSRARQRTILKHGS